MSLRPFHTFAYNGNVYLLNIEDRHCQRIDDATVRLLNRWAASPSARLEPEAERILDRYRLLPETTTRTVEKPAGSDITVRAITTCIIDLPNFPITGLAASTAAGWRGAIIRASQSAP